jgi:hypothetical protein
MKTIFKEGDRVYFHVYGWGKIFDIDVNVGVKFENLESYKYFNIELLKALSFTEYKLEGFSQERPEELPKIGDVVWGKGFHTTDWSIGHYLGKQHASYKISSTPNALSYWLAFTITTKNPYENN